MQVYYKSELQHKYYKLQQEAGKTWLYWVTFSKLKDGSFQIGRGRDLMKNWEMATETCLLLATPATADEYTKALDRYFRANQLSLIQYGSSKK